MKFELVIACMCSVDTEAPSDPVSLVGSAATVAISSLAAEIAPAGIRRTDALAC
jgi:hypothetical protein